MGSHFYCQKPQTFENGMRQEMHYISMLGNKHAFSGCYVCELMHAMSTSTVHPLNTINNNTALTVYPGLLFADVTMPNNIPRTFRSQAG